DRFLWWLGTLCGLAGAAVVIFAFYGIVELERKVPFGLVHLLLLPLATLAAAAISCWGLKWPPSGQATPIGRVLLGVMGTKDGLTDRVATARLVNPIFYCWLGLSIALNLMFILSEPLSVTQHINRALLLPVVLGLPVVVLTWLTYWSVRWRVPLVLVLLAIV